MNKKGFTMIELLVAVAIMGVLTIIAIPSVKHVQSNNQKTKYNAYEKAVKNSTKAYVDSFEEDLFGSKNTGCAKVKYSELKEKDLIQDIQLKGIKCDVDDETYVYVLKSKTGNRVFLSNIVCRNGNEIVYENKETNRKNCTLDDGKGPEVSAVLDPQKKPYYIGNKPKAVVTLSDAGIGVKANQKLQYNWTQNGVSKATGTLKFKNKNYDEPVVGKITIPDSLEDIHEPTNYILFITGSVYDVNGNETQVNIKLELVYFVGALHIRMNTNRGDFINPHGAVYAKAADDSIVHKKTGKIITRIKYKEQGTLQHYNNINGINIRRAHYHMEDKQWKDKSGRTFSQDGTYSVGAFGIKESNLIHKDETVDLYANWKIDQHTLTYDSKGGSTCSPKSIKKDYGSKWGTLCNPTKTGYHFTGWKIKGDSTIITASSVVTKDITVEAQWEINTCNITYSANGGKFTSRGITQKCDYGKPCTLIRASKLGATKVGNHIVNGIDWIGKGNGKTFANKRSYRAENICDNLQKGNQKVTLLANWELNTYTLTYDNAGGVGCTSISKKYGSTWGSFCVPSLAGYDFIGWTTYPSTNEFSLVTNNVTAIANWRYNAWYAGVSTYCTRDGVANWYTHNGTSRGTCDGWFSVGATTEPAGHWLITVGPNYIIFDGTHTVKADNGHTYCFYVYIPNTGYLLAAGCDVVPEGYESYAFYTW